MNRIATFIRVSFTHRPVASSLAVVAAGGAGVAGLRWLDQQREDVRKYMQDDNRIEGHFPWEKADIMVASLQQASRDKRIAPAVINACREIANISTYEYHHDDLKTSGMLAPLCAILVSVPDLPAECEKSIVKTLADIMRDQRFHGLVREQGVVEQLIKRAFNPSPAQVDALRAIAGLSAAPQPMELLRQDVLLRIPALLAHTSPTTGELQPALLRQHAAALLSNLVVENHPAVQGAYISDDGGRRLLSALVSGCQDKTEEGITRQILTQALGRCIANQTIVLDKIDRPELAACLLARIRCADPYSQAFSMAALRRLAPHISAGSSEEWAGYMGTGETGLLSTLATRLAAGGDLGVRRAAAKCITALQSTEPLWKALVTRDTAGAATLMEVIAAVKEEMPSMKDRTLQQLTRPIRQQ